MKTLPLRYLSVKEEPELVRYLNVKLAIRYSDLYGNNCFNLVYHAPINLFGPCYYKEKI